MKFLRAFWILTIVFSAIWGQAQDTLLADYSKNLEQYRKDYVKALLVDERSPLKEKDDADNIGFYEVDEDLVLKCLFIGASGAKPFEMATYSGETKPYVKYGELLFEIPGKGTQRLSVYQSLKALKIEKYKDHLFIPFKDLTTGDSTYGGGRYIDISKKDIDKGIVMLDFNKAYNPWCAYGEGFSCPIPPQENNLRVAIEAGELSYDDEEDTDEFNKS